MVKVEGYFKAQPKTSELWFNHTGIVRMDRLLRYPKEEMTSILVEIGAAAGWTEERLRKYDKIEKLQGIARLFHMAQITLSDQLPTRYRPLLRRTLVEGTKEVETSPPKIERDGSGVTWCSNGVKMGVNKLQNVVNNFYTVIRHVLSRKEIPVPEDFMAHATGAGAWVLDRNWSWDSACLRGKRTNESILKLFHEAMDDEVDFQYNKAAGPLTDTMNRLLAKDPSLKPPGQAAALAADTAQAEESAVKDEPAFVSCHRDQPCWPWIEL
eukprot:1951390-Amphidinium_carterae.1